MIYTTNNAENLDFKKAEFLSKSGNVIKTLYLASESKFLFPADFIEYGMEFIPDKYKFNSDTPLNYLDAETKKLIDRDITKPYFATLGSNNDDPSIYYFGSVLTGNQRVYAIPCSDPEVKTIRTGPLDITFENDKELWAVKVVFIVVADGKEIAEVNLENLAFFKNINPLRNLNQTYLRNDELYNLEQPVTTKDGWTFDSLSGTILGNSVQDELGKILTEKICPDTYSLMPRIDNLTFYKRGDIIGYVGEQYTGTTFMIKSGYYECTKSGAYLVSYIYDAENNYLIIGCIDPAQSPNWKPLPPGTYPDSKLYDPKTIKIRNKYYEVGDTVMFGGKLYRCNKDTSLITRLVNPEDVDLRIPQEITDKNWELISWWTGEILDYPPLPEFRDYKKGDVVRASSGSLYQAKRDCSNYLNYKKPSDIISVYLVSRINDITKDWEEEDSRSFTYLPDTWIPSTTEFHEYNRGEIVIYKNRLYQSQVNHNYNFWPDKAEQGYDSYGTTDVNELYVWSNDPKLCAYPDKDKCWKLLEGYTVTEYNENSIYNRGDLVWSNNKIWVSLINNNTGAKILELSKNWTSSPTDFLGSHVKIVTNIGFSADVIGGNYCVDVPEIICPPGYYLPKRSGVYPEIATVDVHWELMFFGESKEDYFGRSIELCGRPEGYGDNYSAITKKLASLPPCPGADTTEKDEVEEYDLHILIKYWKEIELAGNVIYLEYKGPFRLPVVAGYATKDYNAFDLDMKIVGDVANINGFENLVFPETEFTATIIVPKGKKVRSIMRRYVPINTLLEAYDPDRLVHNKEYIVNYHEVAQALVRSSDPMLSDDIAIDEPFEDQLVEIKGDSIEITDSIDKNGALVYILKFENSFYYTVSVRSYINVELSDYSMSTGEWIKAGTNSNGFVFKVFDESKPIASVTYWLEAGKVKYKFEGEVVGGSIIGSNNTNFRAAVRKNELYFYDLWIDESGTARTTVQTGKNLTSDLYLEIYDYKQ